jgi:hypothetical protein
MSMVHWINPINGTWNTAFDWSADAIPGGSDNVFIDATGPTYSVTSIQSNAAGTLTIVSNATLTIASSVFTIFGNISNAGAIQIAAASNNAELATNGAVSLSGGGTVTLSNSGTSVPGALIAQATGGSPLTNVDNTIEGFGQIGGNSGLALVNQGTVDANVSGQMLALNGSGGVTNSNLLEATNSGTLAISTGVTNTGGNITAKGGTVAISNSATITGGTLNSTASGLLETIGEATLNGVMISSGTTYTIGTGSRTHLVGTINNAGTIQITAGSNNAQLDSNGPASLTGGGTVTLSNSGSNVAFLVQAASGSPLTNVDNTIEGFGQIGGNSGLALVNQGTVDANVSGQTLALNGSGGVTNSNLLEATNGGLLDITSAIGGSGQLEIGAGSEIELGSATSEMTTFTGAANAKLRLDLPAGSYTGTIASFAQGDILELANTNALTATPTLNGANTTITVSLNGGGSLIYTLAGNLTNDTFNIAHVGPDSDITVTVPLAGQIGLTAATEGVALAGTTTLASFTDTNTSDTASTFTASINWGDGTTSTGTVTGSNGAFTVSGGHTYADEGSFPLGVSITDTANNTSLPLSGTVVAAEADVLTPQGVTFAANPGQAFSGTVATFTDGDTSNVAGDFSATINWGDGTTTTGVIADTAGAIAVSGTHTYVATGQDAVTVTLTDDTPGMATTTADSTANVGPQLVVKVTLSGTPQEGQTLTAGASSNDDQATIHYQWQSSADGVTFSSIANAAGGATYLVQETDEGREIRVIATAADPGTNAAGSATSSPTLAVTDAPPTLSVSISGTAQEGQTLTAIGVANSGDAVISYRWQVLNGSTWVNIAGATKSTYLVTEANEGHQLRVKATSSDVDGTGTSATSAPTASAIDIAPALSVTVSGAAQQGQILTATANAVSDGDGGKITYQWQELVGLNWVAIAGATHATYTATEAVEGDQIRTLATFTDDTGQTVSATSLPTTPVLDVTPTLSVTVSGTAQEGQKLTAHALVTSDRDGGATTYQWQKLVGTTWTDITGATASTYQVAELDEGYQIRVAAAFTDDAGQIAFATSAATASAIDIKPTLSMTVGGVAQEGQTLMATAIANDFDAIIGYQWQQLIGGNWTNIIGATGSAYPITEANEGSRLRVVATSSDSDGSGTSATSTATASVLDSAPSVTVPNPPSLFVAAGGSALLPLSVSGFDPDDKVTVKIAGLPAFETITDNLDKKTFSGSSVTLTAAEVNSGLTLHSSYGGTGQPVNVLTVTAANTTAGEGATSAAQTITVTDPPAPSTLAGAQDRNGALQDLAVDQRVALLGQYMASTFTPSGAGDAATLPADPMAPTPQQVSLVQPQHL